MLNASGLLYPSERNFRGGKVFRRRGRMGHYVMIFAKSLIAYRFGAQWMRFSYFASGGKRVAKQDHVPVRSAALESPQHHRRTLTGILPGTLRMSGPRRLFLQRFQNE
jgi:hypothetical protein